MVYWFTAIVLACSKSLASTRHSLALSIIEHVDDSKCCHLTAMQKSQKTVQDNGKVNKRVLMSLDGTEAFSSEPATNFMTSLPLPQSLAHSELIRSCYECRTCIRNIVLIRICTLSGVCCACDCVQCSVITMSPSLYRPRNLNSSLSPPWWHINVKRPILVLKPVTPSHSHLHTNYGC